MDNTQFYTKPKFQVVFALHVVIIILLVFILIKLNRSERLIPDNTPITNAKASLVPFSANGGAFAFASDQSDYLSTGRVNPN